MFSNNKKGEDHFHFCLFSYCVCQSSIILAVLLINCLAFACINYIINCGLSLFWFVLFYLFIFFHRLPLSCHIIIIPFFLPCLGIYFGNSIHFLNTSNCIDPCNFTYTVWWLYFLWAKLEYQAYYLSIFHKILLIIAPSRKLFSYDRMGLKLLRCVYNLPSKKKKKKKERIFLWSRFRLDHLLHVCNNAHMRVCVFWFLFLMFQLTSLFLSLTILSGHSSWRHLGNSGEWNDRFVASCCKGRCDTSCK